MLSAILVVFACLFSGYVNATDRVVCYYMSSNGYQAAPPENLDANLCTHLNYAFVVLQSNGSLSYYNYALDVGLDLYGRVNALKEINPNLKVLLSVGGTTASVFSTVASDKEKRSVFVKSAKFFVKTYKFDGIDIDWEFPTASDKENFISLLEELKTGFNETDWIITAALSAIPRAGYNVPKLSEILDYINIMSYDYYGSWSVYTGQNSPLFQASIESGYEKAYCNVAVTAVNWVNGGADPKKMNIGLAFYGRQFTLSDPNVHDLHAPIIQAESKKTAAYSKICQEYTNWTRVFDEEQKNPYKYQGDQWIGYDDEESIQLKVEHVISKGYGGVMVWHIGSDDVYGKCGEPQGLLNLVNRKIFDGNNINILI